MKIASWTLLIALALLSLAAGGAKLAQVSQEVAFFEAVGLGAGWMLALGAVQTFSAIGAMFSNTRAIGLSAMALGFLASSAMFFATGDTRFGLASLVPAVLCVVLIWRKDTL